MHALLLRHSVLVLIIAIIANKVPILTKTNTLLYIILNYMQYNFVSLRSSAIIVVLSQPFQILTH